jgi:DNA-binding response OmpR family regulator
MKCVLIVDDELPSLALQVLVIERFGFKVMTAGNGREALDRFKTSVPDLVITDVNMPDMDGLALCRAIKASWNVPVIMISGHDYGVEAKNAGAEIFINRPFIVPFLRSQIQELLGEPCPN